MIKARHTINALYNQTDGHVQTTNVIYTDRPASKESSYQGPNCHFFYFTRLVKSNLRDQGGGGVRTFVLLHMLFYCSFRLI